MKNINLKNLVTKILEMEIKSTDSVISDDLNKPKVEDETKAEKDLPNKKKDDKIQSPAGSKKVDVDKQSKHKGIKLALMIPIDVTRNSDDETPEVDNDFDENEEGEVPVDKKIEKMHNAK